MSSKRTISLRRTISQQAFAPAAPHAEYARPKSGCVLPRSQLMTVWPGMRAAGPWATENCHPTTYNRHILMLLNYTTEQSTFVTY
jgi:hypothetical protein